jgi:23S rRNA pseudouridine2604 synthase
MQLSRYRIRGFLLLLVVVHVQSLTCPLPQRTVTKCSSHLSQTRLQVQLHNANVPIEDNVQVPPLDHPSNSSSAATGTLRLNKIFTKRFSRRACDTLIEQGRVKVNGEIVHDMGRRVIPHQDIIELDDVVYENWEKHCNIPPKPGIVTTLSPLRQKEEWVDTNRGTSMNDTLDSHVYIKYWKPVGVISTTDRNVPNNLLDAMYDVTMQRQYDPYHQYVLRHGRRIFNVGRLDKDSSGLLLLTSDGRIPNVVLAKHHVHCKVYYVVLDRPISWSHLQRLRQGMVIATDTVRGGKHRPYSAKTLPCAIEPLYHGQPPSSRSGYIPTTELQMTLTEGRNRQIRVMLQTVGQYQVQKLHRINFMSHIDLTNLQQPGDWTFLNATEWNALQEALRQNTTSMDTANTMH